MSITRTQTAKRLLNSIAPKGEKLAYINDKEAKLLKKMGGAGIDVNGTGIRSYFDPGVGAGSVSESLSEAAGVGSGYSGGNSGDSGSRGNFATINRGPRTVSPTRDEAIQNPFGITRVNRNFIAPNAAVNRRPSPTEFIEEEETPIGVRTGDVFPGLNKVTARDVFKVSADNPMLHRSIADQIAISTIPVIGNAINLGERFAYDLPAFRFSRTGGTGPTIPTGGGDNMPMPMMPFRSPELPSDV